ncbi:MAG: hypothetical protein M3Y41_10770 [Pseudomonadota bacterium]|nr:hypothetical protein [Pseudomonadota bacterium]
MSAAKKGFSAFLRTPEVGDVSAVEVSEAAARAASGSQGGAPVSDATSAAPTMGERIREVTPSGRVRTYSATRQLPGVTLRLSEERWERLKMLSIQQRRPIQDILGEATEMYMRARGLPW